MRLLALQTNVAKMKKQFIAEGEEELLCSRRHIFSFLFPMLLVIFLTIGVVAACIASVSLNNAYLPFVLFILVLWGIFFFYQMAKALIAWRYNFLIVTTEKIVIVNHKSFFHQEIHPIHIENILSTRTESQYFGIGNCGTLFINLEEKVDGGNSQHICVPTLPKPAVIGGMIENAVVLNKQRVPVDQGPADQQLKVEELKEKVEEATKKDSAPAIAA